MMKSQSLICSVAVAGTLLAATAFPSAAATYFVDVVETPLVGAVDFTYDITLSAPTSLTISGFEAGITNFDASLFNRRDEAHLRHASITNPPVFLYSHRTGTVGGNLYPSSNRECRHRRFRR